MEMSLQVSPKTANKTPIMMKKWSRQKSYKHRTILCKTTTNEDLRLKGFHRRIGSRTVFQGKCGKGSCMDYINDHIYTRVERRKNGYTHLKVI
ncbi:hypothetical protein POTOM_028500 [Populus tomentosa]|uniref:Uncharacterized protein n=1 Tax=Populus tomentosa TaxID=118781 RepID=A0A8X7Z955_POPTO|nr:hypothetical protein POTOM_028500 [Populus tomentosa]